jgi:hypothetical protein
MHRRAFGKSADELIEEFLCAYLKMEWVAAVLDADVQEIEREKGNVLIAVIDIVYDGNSCFSGR